MATQNSMLSGNNIRQPSAGPRVKKQATSGAHIRSTSMPVSNAPARAETPTRPMSAAASAAPSPLPISNGWNCESNATMGA
ncbi:hypothetical protein D3C78_1474500 [compost metagenome]